MSNKKHHNKKNIQIYILILFIGFGLQLVVGQEKINQFNTKGKREGVWKKYYNNKRIRYQGQFNNGKEIGVFKFYSASNSEYPEAIKTFEQKSNFANVKFYSEKGLLKSEGEMKGKIRIGKWKYYHVNSKNILSEENYTEGILNGESKTYYKNGKLTEHLFYKNGKLNGRFRRYADNGNLLDDLNYVEGKLYGSAKYYNIKGKLIYWGDYENDQKIGKWNYFEKGKPNDSIKMKSN